MLLVTTHSAIFNLHRVVGQEGIGGGYILHSSLKAVVKTGYFVPGAHYALQVELRYRTEINAIPASTITAGCQHHKQKCNSNQHKSFHRKGVFAPKYHNLCQMQQAKWYRYKTATL
jgi:hypothetical protein